MTLDQRIAQATQSAETMVAELDIPALERRRPPRYRLAIGMTVAVVTVTVLLAVGLALGRTGTPQVVTQPDGGGPSNGVILVGGLPSDPDGVAPSAINPDGSEAEDFRDLGEVSDFAWAPDGRRLAIVDESGLSTLDVETGDAHLLYESCRTPATTAGRPDGYCEVAWSPDGRTIAAANIGGLLFVDASSGAASQLIQVSAANPVWSPDSESVAFASGPRLYTVDTDGSDLRLLGDGESDMWTSPIWVPQIDRVVFLSVHPDLPGDLVLMSIDPYAEGAEAIEIAVLGQCFCLGLWPGMVLAPDGTRALIYGPLDDTGNFGLFTMDLDGSNLVRLDTEIGGSNLAWQPVP